MLRKIAWFFVALLSLEARGAVLEGIVVESRTGRPVARARVSLQSLAARSTAPKPVLTDSRGRFIWLQMGAGAFLLTTEKRGYVPNYYGQKRWNGPGTPIVLERDGRFTAEVRLSRLGAVSGSVSDENGIGLPDVQVFAYRDTRPLRLAGQTTSDDRGAFRIAGLEPGRYRVRSGAKQLEDDSGLLPTYYGDSVSLEGSTQMEVRLDDETEGIEIHPLPGKLLRLRGQVAFPGAPLVTLYSDLGRRAAPVDRSGHFSFDELIPGRVELFAETVPPGRTGYAGLWLASDMENIILESSPNPGVQFRCEDRDGAALRAREITLRLTRTLPAEEARSEQVSCGGYARLSVGTWRFSASTPQRYAVSAFHIQGKPAETDSIQFLPGQVLELTLQVSGQAAAIRGKLLGPNGLPAAGAMVFLNATETRVGQLLFGKGAARTDARGEFAFEGLPPGRYKVAGSFDVQFAEEVDWTRPSLPTVDLEEGKEVSLDVPL